MAPGQRSVQFGPLLQRYRLAAGLSQEELAERAGLSRRGISDLERGARRAPHPATVRRLSEALRLPESERGVLLGAARGSSGRADPAAPAGAVVRHNLPLQLTSFIGRRKELAEVQRLLAGGRLVTLTGPGGVGKTRLALRVAESVLDGYPDGIWFVDLAPLGEPALVPQLVASALGVREQPDEPLLATLARAVRPLQLLLVLDNCEHLLGACVELVDTLLRNGPQVRVLTTSREVLGIGVEQVWRVPPLGLPDPQHLPAVEQLAHCEAVRLFTDRACTAKPGFRLTNQNAPAVAHVCQRLDGIPLAIELAAARLRVLSLTQLEGRLAEYFRILRCGSRMAPERQQTLRATIDWSFDLLSHAERRLFQQLAVFAGGWTVEAAEAVCRPAGDQSTEVLDLLTGLVDKSLVVAVESEHDDEDEPRYRFLETVRAYAAERLLESGEIERARDRHLAWATDWAEGATPYLTGPDQVRWMHRFVREHDNFRSALEWARVRRHGEAELRLAAALARFWHLHGPSSEGRAWLRHALAHGPTGPSLARATALNWAGRLATMAGDADARALLEQSVAMARELGDGPLLALALRHLGLATQQRGEPAAARALLVEALNTARAAGDRREQAFALANIGVWDAHAAGIAGARQVVDEAIALAHEVGDRGPLAVAWCARGILAVREGHADEAAGFFAQALDLARASGHVLAVVSALIQLGALALSRGDTVAARAHAQRGVAAAQESGDQGLIAAGLRFFASVELHEHRYQRAVRLLASESGWRQASPARQALGVHWVADTPNLSEARRELGTATFSREWSIGQRMTLEQAAALAAELEAVAAG